MPVFDNTLASIRIGRYLDHCICPAPGLFAHSFLAAIGSDPRQRIFFLPHWSEDNAVSSSQPRSPECQPSCSRAWMWPRALAAHLAVALMPVPATMPRLCMRERAVGRGGDCISVRVAFGPISDHTCWAVWVLWSILFQFDLSRAPAWRKKIICQRPGLRCCLYRKVSKSSNSHAPTATWRLAIGSLKTDHSLLFVRLRPPRRFLVALPRRYPQLQGSVVRHSILHLRG